MTIIESYESYEIYRSIDEQAIELKATLTGDEDTSTVEGDFITWLAGHSVAATGVLRSYNLRHLGGGVHEGTATYTQNIADVVKTIRYNTQGASARIIQSLSTIYSAKLGGGTAPSYGGLINVTKDGIEGVDVPVPSCTFTVDYRFGAITTSFLRLCNSLTGTVNNASFLGYGEGELLFKGIAGEIGLTAGGAVVLSGSPTGFAFEFSPTVTNLVVGSFTIPTKQGWDYLWPRTVEDVSNNAVIRKTVAVYVERIFRRTDFTQLGIS